MKLPDSQLEKLLKLSRKRYRWAIGSDVILIIVFVLVCSLSYKVYIHGSYNGDAIHCISEINNDSYSYCSSTESLEEMSDSELNLLEKGTSSINEINERYTLMNPELKGPISSVGSKRSNRSHKIQENLLNLKNYEKYNN